MYVFCPWEHRTLKPDCIDFGQQNIVRGDLYLDIYKAAAASLFWPTHIFFSLKKEQTNIFFLTCNECFRWQNHQLLLLKLNSCFNLDYRQMWLPLISKGVCFNPRIINQLFVKHVMRSREISLKSNLWHFQFSIWLKCLLKRYILMKTPLQ